MTRSELPAALREALDKCPDCEGTGVWIEPHEHGASEMLACQTCKGTGKADPGLVADRARAMAAALRWAISADPASQNMEAYQSIIAALDAEAHHG